MKEEIGNSFPVLFDERENKPNRNTSLPDDGQPMVGLDGTEQMANKITLLDSNGLMVIPFQPVSILVMHILNLWTKHSLGIAFLWSLIQIFPCCIAFEVLLAPLVHLVNSLTTGLYCPLCRTYSVRYIVSSAMPYFVLRK